MSEFISFIDKNGCSVMFHYTQVVLYIDPNKRIACAHFGNGPRQDLGFDDAIKLQQALNEMIKEKEK